MDTKEFGQLCVDTAKMLEFISKQANDPVKAGKLQFHQKAATETIEPLAQLIAAIAAAAK